MEVNWIISNRKYRIVYKHYTKRKQPTSHSAQPSMADPGLSQSTIGSAYPPSSRPAARSGGSGGRKMKTLGIKIQFSTKRPKKVKRSGFVLWMNDTVKSMAPSWMKKYFKKKGASNLSLSGTYSTLDTALNSSQPGDSPLYPGKTRYGGRAASRSPHRRAESPCQSPVRRPITAKPARAQPCGVKRHTARSILQSLASMSSPVADAKKIPMRVPYPPSPMVSNLPPVQKLMVPDAASVSGNILTPGGEGRDVDMTPKETPTSHSAQPSMADPGLSQSTIGSAYPPSSRPAARSGGSGGRKMKTLGIKIQFSTKRPKKVKRSGFVLWMNDTVKSMAPSWMKKYFKKKGASNLSLSGTYSTLDTALNSSQPGDSPLYPGKTRYGGRAASRSPHRRAETPCQSPVRRPITAKPARAQPCGVKRHTGRSILQSLASMSSPVADAKKIPMRVPYPPSPMVSNLPPVQKLMVPDAASVSGNILTPGGEGRDVDMTPKETPTSKSPHLPMADPSPSHSPISSSDSPLSSTNAASSGGKPADKSEEPFKEVLMNNCDYDSAAAPDPSLVSDFCYGPAGAPPKDTSPTTTSTQKPSLFDNSYSSMQAAAPGSLEFGQTYTAPVGGLQFKGASEDWDLKLKPVRRPPHYTSSTTTSTLKHSLFGYSYSSLQAAAPGSLEFGQTYTAPDSAAAPDPPLVSDFCHGPAGAPPKDTSPTTTSIQKPSLFDNSYSSMQAAAPGSLEFGQTYTAPVGGLQFKGASEDWDLKLKPVRRPPHYTSSTTTSTLKHSLFGYSYSSLQAAAPGSLEFGQPYTAPDSAAAPDPPLVSDFCHGPAGAPTKDTSPTTTSTQKPSLFDNSYSSMQAAAPGSLEFGQPYTAPDSAAAPDPPLVSDFCYGPAGAPPKDTSPTTTSTQKPSLFDNSYSSLQAAAPGSLEFGQTYTAPVGGLQFKGASEDWDPKLKPVRRPPHYTSSTTTSTLKHSLFGYSYSSLQAAAPGSLEFGQPYTAPDSAAAPDPPLVSDFCYGPAGAPPKDTSPSTTSTQKPSLFDNSYSSMQAAAPGSLEFGQTYTAPVGGLQFKGASEDWDPKLKPVRSPHYTSSTTTSTLKHSLFGYSYSSLQAAAPGSLEFGQPYTAPDSAAAPDPPLVSDFCYGPAGAPPKDTSPTTTSTQKPSLFDNSYSSMQAAAPGSLEFGQTYTAPDSAAAPDPPLVSDFCYGPAGAPTKDTSPTTTSTQKPSLFDNSYSSMQAAAPGSLEFGQPYTAPDSAAAPDPPLVSDFCHGPAGAPPKDTSPTTTSTQKPSLFDNSYSSMQAEAPGSLEFGQTYTAPDSAAAPDPPLVSDFCYGPAGAPTKDTSPTTTSTQKPSLFDNSYSSMQAAAPGSLEFGQPYTAPDSAAAPDPPLVSDFCHGPAGAPPKDTSPSTTSTQKPSLFDNSYSSMQAEAPGSLEFGQTYTAPDSAAAPDPPLVSDFCYGPAGAPPKDTSPTTTSTQKPSLFDNSYSSMQAAAPGSLEFGQTYTAPDSAAAPDPPLVSDFCHGPAGAPPKDTSPTTTSTQKPSLFDNSYSSMQAAAPGSLEFGQTYTAPDSVAAPDPPLVSDFCYGPAGAPPKDTSPSTTSTQKPSLFDYSYSSLQAPAPGSLEFGQPYTAPDSAAAPDPPLVSDFCYGPAGAPPKDTSPTTTSTQKPSLFDNSYSSMQAAAPGSLEFGQTYTAPVGGSQFEGASEDWDPNPEPVWRPPHYTSSSSGDPTNTTSSTTTSTLKHTLFGYSYSSLQAPAPGSPEFGQTYTAPAGGSQFKGASEDWDPNPEPVWRPRGLFRDK